MTLERVFAVLFILSNKENNMNTTSIFGDIHQYCIFGQTYEDYKITILIIQL